MKQRNVDGIFLISEPIKMEIIKLFLSSLFWSLRIVYYQHPATSLNPFISRSPFIGRVVSNLYMYQLFQIMAELKK